MQGQESKEMPDIDYFQLEAPPLLDECLLATIDSNIKGNNWNGSHQCISMIRRIIKFHPEYIPDVTVRYTPAILDHFNNGRPQILKNLLRLVNEIFMAGQQINVEKAVYAFLPVLLKKSAIEKGFIKEMSQEALTSFTSNCGYDISFIIASQYCCDKNVVVAQFSLKLLAALIQNIGAAIVKLNQNTLVTLMRVLITLIEGKRNNMKTNALDICFFIYSQIGSQNYLQLMNFSLKPEEVMAMGQMMESHRVIKHKPEPLSSAIKKRKSEIVRSSCDNRFQYTQNQNDFNAMNRNIFN